MAENCLLNLSTASNELDENKNPSSLNDNSVMNKANEDGVLVSSESVKEYISQNVSDDSAIAGLSIPPKNVLSDSGFHCENFENCVFPSNINNGASESDVHLLANGVNKTNEVTLVPDSELLQTSLCSNNDNSFSSCQDTSFNTVANTTTNTISLLFEKLTLNSDSDANISTHDERALGTSAFTEEKVSNNIWSTAFVEIKNQSVPSKVCLDETFNHPVVSESTNKENLNYIVPCSTDCDLSKPLETSQETIYSHQKLDVNVPINIGERDSSLDAQNLECPDQLMSSKTSIGGIFNSPKTIAVINVPDNIDCKGDSHNLSMLHSENLQDAIFSCQKSDVNGSFDLGGENSSLDAQNLEFSGQLIPSKSSLDGIFNSPKAASPSNVSVNIDCEGLNLDPQNLSTLDCQVPSKSSLDDNLNPSKSALKFTLPVDTDREGLSFDAPHEASTNCQVSFKTALEDALNHSKQDSTIDSPVDIDEKSSSYDAQNVATPNYRVPSKSVPVEGSSNCQVPSECVPDEVYSTTNVPVDINGEGFNATVPDSLMPSKSSLDDTFKCPLPVPVLRNFPDNKISDMKPPDADDNFEREEFQDAVQFFKDPSSLQALENLTSAPATGNMPRDSLYMNFDPLYKKSVQSPNALSGEIKKETNVAVEVKNEGISDAGTTENAEIINKHVSVRESFGNILLSFDSPMKSNSARNSATPKGCLLDNDQKLYTEEELQQALKIHELTMQEHYLMKQKEMEEENSKKSKANGEKLHQMTELCKVLIETMSEIGAVASEQKSKMYALSTKVESLESEKQKLEEDLKTSSEDLQSVETTFSDFHKRYVQCKDMLKTYKDNEDRLKVQVESLNEKLVEQEQANCKLHEKMNEMVDKANAEVASARKGGDAQLAVLKAQLKKSELKVSSLESDLKQVRIENDKLSGICDDLMAKVSEA